MASFLSMAPRIDLLFVLLSLCYLLCLQVFAGGKTATEVLSAELFNLEQIQEKDVQDHNSGKITGGITLKEINLPLLIAAKDGVMVAITEANYIETKSPDQTKYAVVTKYLEAENKNKWNNNNIEEVIKMWKTRLATQSENGGKAFSTIMASVVNADGSKIYLFLLNITNSQDNDWDLKLVVGAVDSQKKDKPITWTTENLPDSQEVTDIKEKLKTKTSNFETIDGYAFLAKEKKILFVVKSKLKEANKYVNVLFLFEEDSGNSKFKLLPDENTLECRSFFFQWGGEIFKALIDDTNDDCNKKLMVFDTKTDSFTEKDSPIARLQGFFKDKKYFTSAFINETKDVLLFTQQEKKSDSKNTVHLWMSDGTRVINVGTIVDGINFDEMFYGSILHTNGELFVLHQTYKTESSLLEENKFSLTRLKVQLTNIKTTLTAWNENGEKIKKFYQITDSTKNFWYTKGLVGFLSDTVSDDNQIWHDKYDYVNATVTNGEKAPDGITLKGKDGKAAWPVGEPEKDQPYNFIDNGLTLVATVQIDKHDNEKGNSLLGVVLNKEGNKRVGLLCSKDKTLIVKVDNNDADLKIKQKDCNEGKLYVVAFVLKTNINIEIYVDGEQLAVLNNDEITVSKTIKEFYFGAKGNTQHATSDVTITNVLLFNRPLISNEIKQFKPEQNAEADSQAVSGNDNGKTTKPGKKVTETDTPSDTSTTENKKQAQSSPTTEDSAVRVRKSLFMFVLFVLLSPCVPALF